VKIAGALFAAAALVCPCVVAAADKPAPPAVERIVLVGHGLGHGIGLSQWGAEERATAGQSLRAILGFYYPGTSLTARPTHLVRVLVAERTTLTVGSRGSFSARDRAGHVWTLRGLQQAGATFAGHRVVYPLELTPGSTPLRVGGVPYGGSVRITRSGGLLLAVDQVGLEQYVTGVVSAECPAYWKPAALEAQAVAARSYALSHLRKHSPFDVYPDDRSQNYRGLARNFAAAGRATAATTGDVLTYHGRIADTMFSASNGGLTNAGGKPYLISRPDPFDARSPAANWGPVAVSAARIEAAFPALAGAALAGVSVRYDNAHRAARVILAATTGKRLAVSGFSFQERLDLRSTYLTIAATGS